MVLSRRSFFLTSGLTLLAGAYGAKSLLATEYTAAWYENSDGVAINGTDPVAYFAEGKAVEGRSEHALEWGGTVWHFANAQNLQTFNAAPKTYAPQYGGYCAWAVGAKSYLAPTDPEQWSIVDGKLYLNYDASVQRAWKKDVPGFIEKGDRNWPGLEAGLQ